MPFYPGAEIVQHGERLLVTSLSFAGGLWPNHWFTMLTTRASDEEIAAAVADALDRSRVEELEDLPRASSSETTVDAERLGFASSGEMEAATTMVALTLVDGDVMVAPYETVPGRGYTGHDELEPASGPAEVAARIRQGLAEAARLSARVVDHGTMAEGDSGHPAGQDEAARLEVGRIRNFAKAVLTRWAGRWAVEPVASLSSPPWEAPTGWARVLDDGDEPGLARLLVEALVSSGDDASSPPASRTDAVVQALGPASVEDLTGPGCVRIMVQVFTSTGEVILSPQVVGDDGWWETPAHPDSRSVGLHDSLPLWGRVIAQVADDLAGRQAGRQSAQ